MLKFTSEYKQANMTTSPIIIMASPISALLVKLSSLTQQTSPATHFSKELIITAIFQAVAANSSRQQLDCGRLLPYQARLCLIIPFLTAI